MSRTILEIGQDLSDDVGLPRYNNLVSNSEQNARKILTSIRDGLLLDVFRDQDWEMLKVRGSVSATGGGVTTYSLPTGFDRIVNETLWDDTNSRPLRGPVDKMEWEEYRSGLAQLAGLETVCTIQGDLTNNAKVISFYPDTSAVTVYFWYISNKCVWGASNIAQASITADDDEPITPYELVRAAAKWRLLRSLGMSFSDERDEYYALLGDFGANDSGGKRINMAGSRRARTNVPDTGYGS